MQLTLLIPLLPLLASAIVLFGAREGEQRRAKIAVLPLLLAFLGSVAALVAVTVQGTFDIRFYDPAAIASFAFPPGFRFDRLSTLMMVLIAGVGTLIFRYSTNYMYEEPGYGRFLALVGATTSVLLCMVTSGNLLLLFVFWQLLSYLLSLLAHNLHHPATFEGARRTFRFHRVGDAAFLAGIVLAYALYGTIEFDALFARAAAEPIGLQLAWGISVSGPTAVTLLVLVGAMSKSAQFPLHAWLPHSLYAPTPVHALLHAGIINAGGFLLNRLAPLYGLSPTTLHVALAVGMVTAVLGAAMMLTQSDIKKTLGFSTIGQMGYMIMECGLGAFALSVFHLIAHGLFKATVFLNCGNVIHKARQEPVMPEPAAAAHEDALISGLSWATGFFATLLIPAVILLVGHGVLHLPLLESQGHVIFLFFVWVTSSQAIMTLARLRAVASWKVAGAMVATLLLVVVTYLWAAETFTRFLYPDPEAVERYFRAAALPGPLFEAIVLVTTLIIVLGWLMLAARTRGHSLALPRWLAELHERTYVLLLNHLYVDAVFARLGRLARHGADRLAGTSKGDADFRPAMVTAGFGVLGAIGALVLEPPASQLAALAACAVALPLFPLHSTYLYALTALPGRAPLALALLLPFAGFFGLATLRDLPQPLLAALGVLATAGMVWGTARALVARRGAAIVGFGTVAAYSTVWWYAAAAGPLAAHAAPGVIRYILAIGLATLGLLLAREALRARFGAVDLRAIGGLAASMPRFALLVALLAIAASGMPPFGIYAGLVDILASPAAGWSAAVVVVILAWLGASWYLFDLTHGALFGRPTAGDRRLDLRPPELASLAIVLVLLLGLGVLPVASWD